MFQKPLTVKDVILDFMQEEWELLGLTRGTLYHGGMLSNYGTPASLGEASLPSSSPSLVCL